MAETITEAAVVDIPPEEVEELVPVLSASTGIEVVKPKWMVTEQEKDAQAVAEKFLEKVKANPNDIMLAQEINSLGEDGSRIMMPQVDLYEKKISILMADNQEGSLKNTTLLEFKKASDFINPAVIKQQPVTTRVAWLFKKTGLPGSEKVLSMIYERRETVKSTMEGIKKTLWTVSEGLKSDLIQLDSIYKGLISGQQTIERDIYIGQTIYTKLSAYVTTLSEGIAKQNVEEVLATTVTVINSLQTEENINMQFFAGSQMVAKLTIQQLDNIKRMSSLLERSILASLGLAVVAAELRASIKMTEGLKEAIGNTLVDTAKSLNKTSDQLTKVRSGALVNLDKLEEACNQLDELFKKQANANKEIISRGALTSNRLSAMTDKLRARVEDGKGNVENLTNSFKKEETE